MISFMVIMTNLCGHYQSRKASVLNLELVNVAQCVTRNTIIATLCMLDFRYCTSVSQQQHDPNEAVLEAQL